MMELMKQLQQLLGAPVGQPFPIDDWSADHENKDAALEMLGLWQ